MGWGCKVQRLLPNSAIYPILSVSLSLKWCLSHLTNIVIINLTYLINLSKSHLTDLVSLVTLTISHQLKVVNLTVIFTFATIAPTGIGETLYILGICPHCH